MTREAGFCSVQIRVIGSNYKLSRFFPFDGSSDGVEKRSHLYVWNIKEGCN